MGSSSNTQNRRYSANRYRALARSLHARIYATTDGRLLLIGGTPNFARLHKYLTRLADTPSESHYPSPTDLGFPAYADGELSAHGLHTRARALNRWSQDLDRQCRQRRSQRRSRWLLAERREIDRLRNRLQELQLWFRRSASVDSTGHTPFVLACREEELLESSMRAAQHQSPLPPLARWLARFVLWAAGKCALSRFLAAVSPITRQPGRVKHTAQLRQLLQHLHRLKQRSHVERADELHAELRGHIRRVDATLVAQGRLTARLRRRSIHTLCELLIERCATLLQQYRAISLRRIPVGLAALMATGGSTARFPSQLVNWCLDSDDCYEFDQITHCLHLECGEPKYDELLAALQQLDPQPKPSKYRQVRKMLVAGNTADEVSWANQRGLLNHFTTRFPRVAWARSLAARLELQQIQLSKSEFSTLLTAVHHSQGATAFDRFTVWMGGFSPTTLTSRLREQLCQLLIEVYAPAVARLACHVELRGWGSVGRRPRPPAASSDFVSWMRHCVNDIFAYQDIANEPPTLPKSLKRLVEAREARQRERAFLQAAAYRGTATTMQMARLSHLEESKQESHGVSVGRLQRTAEEARFTAGTEALRAIVRRAIANRWTEATGVSFTPPSIRRGISLVTWVQDMDEPQRQLLRLLLEAYRDHGADYKRYLPANRAWLSQAARHGILVDAWQHPPPHSATVDGRHVTISVAHNPHEIFLMGNYFKTCLSLGDCNEMSVLANAYDANKHVLFIHDSQQRVLARQLVAVSRDFQLLGYYCYVAVDHRMESLRNDYISAIAGYCGRWAHRCKISLADDCTPEPVGDHFWYDDGAHAWHQEAQRALTDSATAPHCPAPSWSPDALVQTGGVAEMAN